MTAKYYEPSPRQPQSFEPSQADRSAAAAMSARGSFLPWQPPKKVPGLWARQHDAALRGWKSRHPEK